MLATVLAHETVHAEPSRRSQVLLDDLLRQALDHGWHEVEALVWYARLVRQADNATGDGPVGPHAAAMLKAADRAGDAALVAAALAAGSQLGHRSPMRATSSADRDLARAFALLDEVGGDPAHAPLAYLACGNAYTDRALWELAIDSYQRAGQLLDHAFLPPMDRVAAVTRRSLLLRELEVRVPLSCHLLELGARDAAAEVASRRPALPVVAAEGDLSLDRLGEIHAVSSLLAAVAREDEPIPPYLLLESLHPTERATSRALVMLGQAIRAWDDDQNATAAARAEIAVLHLTDRADLEALPLAMRLAALADRPATGWQRYAEENARRRAASRQTVLDAARAQLDAERVMLENERLSHRAYVDELTGLANRHAFSRQTARLRLARAEDTLGVLMVDVDHFKSVNDTFGHQVGDAVLRDIGALLLGLTRPSDVAVRMGGDEFLVLLISRGGVDAESRGAQLVEAVRDHPWIRIAPGLRVAVSVGAASGPATAVDDLIAAADRSLYQAKTEGRSRIGAAG